MRHPLSAAQWAEAERLYAETDTDIDAICRRLDRKRWAVYTHMTAKGLHRPRGGASAWKARRKRRTRLEQQRAFDRARRARARRANLRIERRVTERAVPSSGPRPRPDLTAYRCGCGARSTSPVCPNGHTINGWIAA